MNTNERIMTLNSLNLRFLLILLALAVMSESLHLTLHAAFVAGDRINCGSLGLPDDVRPGVDRVSYYSPVQADQSVFVRVERTGLEGVRLGSQFYQWNPNDGWKIFGPCCQSGLPIVLAVEPSGAVWMGRSDPAEGAGVFLERYDRTGMKDPGFLSPKGGGRVDMLKLDPEGRVVVVGSFTKLNGVSRAHIARLLSNGNIDTSFDAGQILKDPPSESFQEPRYLLAMQRDGSLIVPVRVSRTETLQGVGLVRLGIRGEMDPNFKKVLTLMHRSNRVVGRESYIGDLIVDREDRILLGGRMLTVDQKMVSVCRLLPDGSFDQSFEAQALGSGGDYIENISAMTLDHAGRILVSGNFDLVGSSRSGRGLVRLLPDGAWDRSLTAVRHASSALFLRGVLADGNLLLSNGDVLHGEGSGDVPPMIIMEGRLIRYPMYEGQSLGLNPRVLGDPVPQLQWLFRGQPMLGETNTLLKLSNLHLDQAGEYSLVASNRHGLSEQVISGLLVRSRADGYPGVDESFRSEAYDFRNSYLTPRLAPEWNAPVVDSENRVYLSTQDREVWQLVRLKAHGAIDSEFRVRPDSRFLGIDQVLPLSSGAVICSMLPVNPTEGDIYERVLVRFLSSGDRDSSFEETRIKRPYGENPYLIELNGVVLGVRVVRDGLYVSRLFSLNPQGGLSGLDVTLGPDSARLIAGKGNQIYVGGTVNGITESFRLRRINAEGVWDESFKQAPEIRTLGAGVAVLPDGRPVVIAASRDSIPKVMRLNIDGSLDANFQMQTVGQIGLPLLVDLEGRIIVGDPLLMNVRRLLRDGDLDRNFQFGPTQDQRVRSFALFSDGRLLTSFDPYGFGFNGYDSLILFRSSAGPVEVPRVASPLVDVVWPGTAGLPFLLSAGVEGKKLSYQWYEDGNRMLGATNEIYLASLDSQKKFQVVVTNELGAVTNGPVRLQRIELAPDPSVGAASVTRVALYEGERVVFKSGVQNTNSYQYLWYRNEEIIQDTRSSELAFQSVDLSHAGCYEVEASNERGTWLPGAWNVDVHPLSELRLEQVQIQGPEMARVLLKAVPGREMVIEWSSDMKKWTVWTKVQTTGAAGGQWVDLNLPKNSLFRFFRVRVLPW